MATKRTPAFAKHVEKISKARKKADEIIKTSDICSDALNAAWEAVFDWLCQSKTCGADLSDLNTAAGIIQKLASSKNALKKSSEDDSSSGGQNSGRRLTPDELDELESELKLL